MSAPLVILSVNMQVLTLRAMTAFGSGPGLRIKHPFIDEAVSDYWHDINPLDAPEILPAGAVGQWVMREQRT